AVDAVAEPVLLAGVLGRAEAVARAREGTAGLVRREARRQRDGRGQHGAAPRARDGRGDRAARHQNVHASAATAPAPRAVGTGASTSRASGARTASMMNSEGDRQSVV